MRKYWLYIESYSFVFRENQTFLFYNTISGQHFKIFPKDLLLSLIERLQDVENGYCIEISDTEFFLPEISEFIQLLRENFCGDVIDKCLTDTIPFFLYPVPSVMKNKEILKSNTILSFGERILEYLHVLTIQITGVCDLKCELCSEVHRQTISCSSFSGIELEIDLFENIFNQISGCNLGIINIAGGNIFQYTHWQKLMFVLHKYPFRYHWYADYRHLFVNGKKLQDIKSLEIILRVIIQEDFDQNILKKTVLI